MTNDVQNNSQVTETKTEDLAPEQLEQVVGGAGSSGGGAGKVSMQDFHFVMRSSATTSLV